MRRGSVTDLPRAPSTHADAHHPAASGNIRPIVRSESSEDLPSLDNLTYSVNAKRSHNPAIYLETSSTTDFEDDENDEEVVVKVPIEKWCLHIFDAADAGDETIKDESADWKEIGAFCSMLTTRWLSKPDADAKTEYSFKTLTTRDRERLITVFATWHSEVGLEPNDDPEPGDNLDGFDFLNLQHAWMKKQMQRVQHLGSSENQELTSDGLQDLLPKLKPGSRIYVSLEGHAVGMRILANPDEIGDEVLFYDPNVATAQGRKLKEMDLKEWLRDHEVREVFVFPPK
jgi:hypothetical protein